MLRTISTVMALVLVAASFSAQDEKGEARRYDVRSLVAALTETPASFAFALSPSPAGGAGEASVKRVWGERDLIEQDGDAIQEFVRFVLQPDQDSEQPRSQIESDDGWISLSATPAQHARVSQALSTLSRELLRTIEIEWTVLPAEVLAEASSPVLDAAKADRLLEVAKPLRTIRTQLRVGRSRLLEAVVRRPYVKDYDVEIAQEIKAADPLVDVICEGVRATVRVDLAPNGGFVIAVEGQAAELNGPMRMQTLNFNNMPASVQLPRTWWTSTSASAKIEDRGALLIGNDVVPRSAWMFRCFAPAAMPLEKTALGLVPIGAATRSRFIAGAPSFRSPNVTGAGAGSGGMEARDGRVSASSADRLISLARKAGAEAMPESERRAFPVGRFVALAGNPQFVTAATDAIGKAVAEAVRGHSFEIRLGTAPGQGFQVPAPADLEALAASLPQRVTSAGLAGDRVIMLAGESHSYLKDRDVEISQGITVDDPIVDTFFTGLSASCRATPSGEGRCAVEVQLEYQELLEMSSIPTGSKEVPEIELPRIAAVVDEVHADVSLGTWTLLHTAPLEGTDRQLVVMIRVRDV